MKLSLGLCLIAAVLSVGDASRTYRGAVADCTRGRRNSVRSGTFGASRQTCVPNACVIYNRKLCACGDNGKANPDACYPPEFSPSSVPSMKRGNNLCSCDPGTVFEIYGYECVCSEIGTIVPELHCVSKRRYGL